MQNQKVNLTLDQTTNQLLKFIAIQSDCSRSEVVRTLITAKANNDEGILNKYSKMISGDRV